MGVELTHPTTGLPGQDLVQPDAADPTEPAELADAEPTNAELAEQGALDSAEDDPEEEDASDREPVTVGAPRASGTKKVASGSRLVVCELVWLGVLVSRGVCEGLSEVIRWCVVYGRVWMSRCTAAASGLRSLIRTRSGRTEGFEGVL